MSIFSLHSFKNNFPSIDISNTIYFAFIPGIDNNIPNEIILMVNNYLLFIRVEATYLVDMFFPFLLENRGFYHYI